MKQHLLTFFITSVVRIATADFQSDLLDFISLVPSNRVAIISGRHFLFDPQFRAALGYLRSPNFEFLVRDEIASSPEVANIFDYLGQEIDLTVIPRTIRRVAFQLRSAEDYGDVRSSSSFVQEISNLLPDYEIERMIQTKCFADPAFANFFVKASEAQFRELVYKARESESLAVAMEVLRNNQVDVDEILGIAFRKIDLWSNSVQCVQ